MAVDDVGEGRIQPKLGQDPVADRPVPEQAVVGILFLFPDRTVGDKIPFERGDLLPPEQGRAPAAPKIPQKIHAPLLVGVPFRQEVGAAAISSQASI